LAKESFPAIFDPKIQFQVVWGAPNPNFALQIGRNQKNFGGSFDGGWKTFRGLPSLKIWERSDKKWGEIRGTILGFQITDNTCAILRYLLNPKWRHCGQN